MPPIFLLHIRGTVVFSRINFLVFLYAAITLYGAAFQQTLSQPAKLYRAPHLNYISVAIRFTLFRFHSLLITESHLLSLISAYLNALIQRVPNPFGLLAEASTKSHSLILGSKAAYAYPRLIAVCYELLRSLKSSYPPFGFLLRPYPLPLLVSLIENDLKTQKVFEYFIIVFNPYTAKYFAMRILISCHRIPLEISSHSLTTHFNSFGNHT